MGQYYKPINIDKKQFLYSHDWGNGLKLMEHSYLTNNFVEAVETLLTPFGPWYRERIVWAGDYADEEKDEVGDEIGTLHTNIGYDDKNKMPLSPFELEELREKNGIKLEEYFFILNHTKKQYVDKRKLPNYGNKEKWVVHPLPLLTAEGNGRGGGDYHDNQPGFDMVGMWARDSISIEKELPKGYSELEVPFEERW